MPTVRVETNLGPDFFPDNFMPMFIVAVAELLGKDKNVMKYVFDTNKDMTIVSDILTLTNLPYKFPKGPTNVDHADGDFFWADISAFTVFADPDFCYELMPKIFSYLEENSKLKERDIYITLNDIQPHHVGRNGGK